jgi:hypothetical protein
MSYYSETSIKHPIQKITYEEAKQYIPLKEDYTGVTVDKCPYYTMTEGEDGWTLVTYYTGRKRARYVNLDKEYDSWVYVISNSSIPGQIKIGYTDLTLEKRAQQLSRSTGVPTPFIVEWAFHCFNGAQVEGEVHRYLEASRVSGNREFFDTSISEARDTIVRFGQNYL